MYIAIVYKCIDIHFHIFQYIAYTDGQVWDWQGKNFTASPFCKLLKHRIKVNYILKKVSPSRTVNLPYVHDKTDGYLHSGKQSLISVRIERNSLNTLRGQNGRS